MKKKRWIVISAVLLLFVSISAIGLITAYLQQENRLDNIFEVGRITLNIEETFADNVKTDVRVQNTGNVEAYVRATVLFSWQDKAGNLVLGTPEEGVDYTISWGDLTTDWLKQGNYYYCKSAISPGANSAVLIANCTQISYTDSRCLVVDIVGQGVQAKKEAVEEAWSGMTVNEAGILSVKE